MIPLLQRDDPFPPVEQALREPNGLLCAGADLSPERLLAAYRRGIFPWYSPGDPLLWWSPDPRMVLFPAELKISRSLARTLRNRAYEVRLDTRFGRVMAECAAPRHAQPGTWISPEMQLAYTRLHALGHAHSVETWIDGELAGGLYGVALGRVFYGESMFARVRDASKIALVHLCRHLERNGFVMIDCQMKTTHLATLGAREISRGEFLARLAASTTDQPRDGAGCWAAGATLKPHGNDTTHRRHDFGRT
ncbi:leucyl/phenylalanyl-tRNA-protein transferase [Sterolibacterium denitrificans]|uniref:Leucyl/phenylalanyl-tRNA--protein transferase n=1 Tax=Sterolibacterium denitrificans TaxID=157592 RepID=A0A7Z7HR86_9PROT|nr:leucyl/phenylalanyl-tRNA--protein transferase [Sterolibacterium denitrificans]SMB26942.1 leucyl/phenylalanyl-tRNA-protein transferase [Sterolibacterium denitrificans]